MSDVTIETENDPVPIVRVIAAQFNRQRNLDEFRQATAAINGVFALASRDDPQAVTIRVKDKHINIERGVAADAAIVIRTNFRPDDKPTIDRLWRHPLLALRASRLLKERDIPWQEAANRFWHVCEPFPKMPRAVRLTCTDEGSELILGEGAVEAEFFGSASALTEVCSGKQILIAALFAGTIKGVYTLEQVVRLSAVTKSMMLGDA